MASPPDGEAGHQPRGRVRLHDGEPFRVAVDLPASLPGNKINDNKMLSSSEPPKHYHLFLRMERLFTLRQIMEMGWSPKALHTKVASCFTIAVRL